MTRNRIPLLVLFPLFLLSITTISAGPGQSAQTQIMLLLDASGSMATPGETGTGATKFGELAPALTAMLNELPADIAVGLRIVGGSPSADCYSSTLYSPLSTGERGSIQDTVAGIHPAGTRALYYGIEQGITDFPNYTPGDRILLVITDAADACNRNFAVLASTYKNTPNQPRIVIFGLDLTNADLNTLGEFVGEFGGRLTPLASTSELSDALVKFAREFTNNIRVHLQDPTGTGVKGDITIKSITNGKVVAETLDQADYSTNLPPDTYQVKARYLGQEVSSEQFTIRAGESKTISLTFPGHLEEFVINLKDTFGNPVKAKVTFINTAGDRIITTDLNNRHKVNLPPDTYTLEIKVGDHQETVYGVIVGPGQPPSRDIEIPIEMGVIEAEVTNSQGAPISALIKILDADGTIIDQTPNSSHLYSPVPPGQYEVTAEANGVKGSQTVYIYQGDQKQVGIELDIPTGSLHIKLRTESDGDAWGWVNLYDSAGNLVKKFAPEVAESPDWDFEDLPEGVYRIEAEVDTVVRTRSGVVIKSDVEAQVTITFPEAVK